MRRPDARDFGCTNVLVLVGVGMMAMKSVVEVVPFDYVSGSHLDATFENIDETQLDLDDRHTKSKHSVQALAEIRSSSAKSLITNEEISKIREDSRLIVSGD